MKMGIDFKLRSALSSLADAITQLEPYSDENRRECWLSEDVRAVVCAAAAAAGIVDGVYLREFAAITLRNLTCESTHKREMWLHAGARTALLESAKPEVAGGVRESACGALRNLAGEAANRREMWADPRFRAALLGSAKPGTADCVRERAPLACCATLRLGTRTRVRCGCTCTVACLWSKRTRPMPRTV